MVRKRGEEKVGSEITRREVTEVSSTIIINHRRVREGVIQGRRYINVRDVCTESGLSFVTERDRIRQSSFASGKFSEITAPYEMWVESEVIGPWLGMAPVEPGSRESDAADLIRKHCEPIQAKPLGYDPSDPFNFEVILAIAQRAVEDKKRLVEDNASKDLIIAEFAPMVESYKILADKEGLFLISDVAKKFGIPHAHLKLMITEELKWAFTAPGDPRLRISVSGRKNGFVDLHMHPPTPTGFKIDPQVRVTSKGLARISDYISSQSSNQSPKVRQIGG